MATLTRDGALVQSPGGRNVAIDKAGHTANIDQPAAFSAAGSDVLTTLS